MIKIFCPYVVLEKKQTETLSSLWKRALPEPAIGKNPITGKSIEWLFRTSNKSS